MDKLAEAVTKVTVEGGKLGEAISQGASTGLQGIEQLSAGLQKLQQDAMLAKAELQKAMMDDISKGGMGEQEKAIAQVPSELIENAIRYANVMGASVPAAQAKARQTADQLERAYLNLQKARSDRNFEREIRGLSELEQATARLNRAKQQERDLEGRLSKTSDDQERIRLKQELARATQDVQRAEERQQAAQKKEDLAEERERLRIHEKQEASVQRLAKAQQEAQKATPQPGGNRLEVATRNLAEAQEELNRAKADYIQLSSSGIATEDAVADARNRVAEATENQTKASKTLQNEHERAVNTLPRLRYALYDVSRTLTRMGTALTGLSVGAAAVSVSMSRDFADVIRTTEAFRDVTGQSVKSMREDFEDLYSSMPVDWGDLTRIGEMAGQMGIASNEVADFTETVTRFSASTDVTVDAAATTMGRLSELLNVTSDEYDNLASSILAVGVNSVATESQIAETSQQIAGIAGTAGLSADEVIGLSAALASIGTPPELSRGIVTRLFTNLMEATNEGGQRLEVFAETAQMSASQFKDAWERDAAGALQAVMQGLGEVEESQAIERLKDLGIQQVRDIPAVLKLSQNYELLAQSMGVAADGYAQGSALAEHYGVVSEEMSSKIHVLKNQFALLLDALGQFTQTDFFKGLVDMATRALNLLTTLANTKMAQWAGGVSVAVRAVVVGLALLAGRLTSAVAASFGLRTALANLIPIMGSSSAAANANSTSLFNLARQMWATRGAANALRATLAGLGVGLALGVASFAVAKITENLQKARNAAESFSGLHDAIAADTQAFREAVDAGEDVSDSYREVEVSAREAAQGSNEMSDSLKDILGITEPTVGGLHSVADAADEATIALGREFAAAVAKSIAENEDLVDILDKGADELSEAGFKVTEYAQALAQGNADEYIDKIRESLSQLNAESMKDVTWFAGMDAEQLPWAEDFMDAADALDVLSKAAEESEEGFKKVNLEADLFNAIAEDMGVSVEELDGKLSDVSDSTDDFRSVLTGFDDSAYRMQGTLYDRAETLIDNGASKDASAQERRASVEALSRAFDGLWSMSEGDAQEFAGNLAEAFAYLEGAEITLADSTYMLFDAFTAAFGSEWHAHLDSTEAHKSVQHFLDAVIAALEARAELEREMAARYSTKSVGLDNWAAASGMDYRDDAAKFYRDSAAAIEKQISAVKGLSSRLGEAREAGKRAGRDIHRAMAPQRQGGGRRSVGQGARDAQEATKDLKEEIRTLKDYASDLSEIWSRAFEIRFSGQQTIDAVRTSIRGMADRFEEARQRAQDLRLQLQTLRGDLSGIRAEISKQEYFLSIATEYGDSARAEQIQARLVELQAELAQKQQEVSKTSKDLSKAQKESSKTLTGSSEAAIKNRSDLMSLLQQYQEHIGALANSGASTKTLQRETERLRQDFVKQATQLGFSRKEIRKYERGFKDVKTAIDRVPRRITVRASMSPAQQAVNEWIARVNKRRATMTVRAKVQKPKSLGSIRGGQYRPSSVYSRGRLNAASIYPRGQGGLESLIRTIIRGVIRWAFRGTILSRFLSTGGLVTTGQPIYRAEGGPVEFAAMKPKGTDTIPAMLTPGEYVMQRKE